MPYLLIVTDDEVADPRKLAAAVAAGVDCDLLGGDGWYAHVDLDDAGGDPRKAATRARQARYRARKRGEPAGSRDTGRRDARDASRDAENDARRDAENDANDAQILEIRPGSNSLPIRAERVTTGKNDASRDASRDATRDATRRDAHDWKADRAPLTDDERARARAGLDAARTALRRTGSKT